MSQEFHNPHGEETPEQVAYQKEVIAQSLGEGQAQQDGPSDSFSTGEGGLDRGFGSGTAGKSSFGSWGDKLKGFVDDLKPNIAVAKSFITLESRITKDILDTNLFPEVKQVATIRKGLALGAEEQAFVAARKAHVRDHFARYLGLDPGSIHPDDVPTVAFGGSGGGYRAMLAFLGYSQAFKQAGLWDLLTYVAGVSGSCWTLGALYTFGEGNTQKVVEHCKRRLSPHHPLSPDAVQKLLGSKLGDYETIGPIIQKQHSGLSTVPMDLYSVFTTGYLFMQEDPMIQPGGSAKAEVAGYHRAWWKWSHAQKLLANGAEPLPILTAIRHERPWKNWADPEHPFKVADPTDKEHEEAKDAWFQWFEMTPYEVGCDELEAFCPTYAFGRPFEEGKSTLQLPEQSLALLLGLCTSAPAGPLSSYLATIQRQVPTGIVGDVINNITSGIAKMWGKQETAVFQNHHPLHASNEHNFMFHYTSIPKGTPRPTGLENSPRIHLIDAGMDNNCPTMPFLHPSREVDVILNMDASSDVQKDSFKQRAEQIGYRRGLKFVRRHEIKAGENTADPDRFKGLYAQIYDGTLASKPEHIIDSYGIEVDNPPAPTVTRECTMVYLPLLPNERAVPGYDPSTAKFSGSYNLVWTSEQVDMIIKTSGANFQAGQDTIKEALWNAWQRKAAIRQGMGGQGGQVNVMLPGPPPGPPPGQPPTTSQGQAANILPSQLPGPPPGPPPFSVAPSQNTQPFQGTQSLSAPQAPQALQQTEASQASQHTPELQTPHGLQESQAPELTQGSQSLHPNQATQSAISAQETKASLSGSPPQIPYATRPPAASQPIQTSQVTYPAQELQGSQPPQEYQAYRPPQEPQHAQSTQQYQAYRPPAETQASQAGPQEPPPRQTQ